MCGIFAYVNHGIEATYTDITKILIQGLRRLEYRGYDSAGIAIDTPGDVHAAQSTLVVRERGNIDCLEALVDDTALKAGGFIGASTSCHGGIAHTRWATHGQPCVNNAHPQSSDVGNEFTVVHNGIITNFQALKAMLERKGFVFESETDTEVVPKLAKFLFDQLGTKVKFHELVSLVMRELDGAYAIIFKSTHFPGELVACKRGSPLLLGIREPLFNDRGIVGTGNGDDANSELSPTAQSMSGAMCNWKEGACAEFFIASDASALVEHTKQVLMLEDDDVAAFDSSGYSIYRLNRKPSGSALSTAVTRVVQTLEIEVNEIMKGKYDHFMQKEIHEQPESLCQTMRGRLVIPHAEDVAPGETPSSFPWQAESLPRIVCGGLTASADILRRNRRIIFVACGTSYHACVAARPLVEELTEVPVQLDIASDMLDRRCPIFRDDTVVFVSQSGETADTLRALEYSRSRGALCVGVTNTVGSALSRSTHCGLHINAGAEIGVASTKAYTSQIVCIVMFTLFLSEDSLRKLKRRQEVMASLERLPDAVRQCLILDNAMKDLANDLKAHESLLVFGRGYNYATALECALKVKEVALMHCEGIAAGEMKHGPLALVDETLPLIVIATNDSTKQKQMSVVKQLRARKGHLIVMYTEGDEATMHELQSEGCRGIPVPALIDCVQPIVNIIPMQLLAYHLAVMRGHNVDMPRNLAKSVTVAE